MLLRVQYVSVCCGQVKESNSHLESYIVECSYLLPLLIVTIMTRIGQGTLILQNVLLKVKQHREAQRKTRGSYDSARCKSGLYISLGGRCLPDILRMLGTLRLSGICRNPENALPSIQVHIIKVTATSWKL